MAHFICTTCKKTAPLETKTYCCSCGGLYQLDFTPPKFRKELINETQFNIFRYLAFFPLKNDIWKNITLGEGMTSIIPFEKNLYVKLDYAMPTLSFKDRGAAMLIWFCKTIGIKKVLQDSSGNAGNSVAAYCARANIECEIFLPKDTSPKKIKMIQSHGAKVTIFHGTRDETAQACITKAFKENIYYASHVYNPIFYQGTKTYIYEVYEQLGRIPENLFIPIGNGTLFLGCQIALIELFHSGCITAFPNIFLVQSEHCAPFYQADTNTRSIIPKQTLAEGIAIAKPMRGKEILAHKDYHGKIKVILAFENDILNARNYLAKQGFFVEYTTAAVYGAYLSYKKKHSLYKDSLLPLCGAGLKSEK